MGKQASLKTEKATSVLLIHGADEFLATARAKEIVNQLVPPDQQTFGLTIVDGAARIVAEAASAVSKSLEAVRTVGFLGRKVVWLKDANFLGNDALSKSKGAQEAVELMTSAITAGFPANNVLVITTTSIGAKSEFMTTCRKNGEVIAQEGQKAPWLRDKDAALYAQSVFRKHGLKASDKAIEDFVKKIGTNTRQIEQEIAKLDIYLDKRRDVRMEDLDAVISVSKDNFMWDLQDAVGNRDTRTSLNVLRRLLFQNEDPIGLVTCIESRFRHLLVFREALDEGWISVSTRRRDYTPPITRHMPPDSGALFDQALSNERKKMTPFTESKLADQARRFTRRELDDRRQMILEARSAMVSSSAPSQLLIRLLIIKLCMKFG